MRAAPARTARRVLRGAYCAGAALSSRAASGRGRVRLHPDHVGRHQPVGRVPRVRRVEGEHGRARGDDVDEGRPARPVPRRDGRPVVKQGAPAVGV